MCDPLLLFIYFQVLSHAMTRGRDVRISLLSGMTSGKRNVPSNSQIFKKTLIVVAATFAVATIVAVMGSINGSVDVAATTAHAGVALTSAEPYAVNVVDRKRLRGYGKTKRIKKDETAEAMRFADSAKWSETLQYRPSPPKRRREANEDIMAQAADAAVRAAVGVEMMAEAAVVGATETDAGATVTDVGEVWDGEWDAPCEESVNDFNAAPAYTATENIMAHAADAAARAAFKEEKVAWAVVVRVAMTDAEAVWESAWDAPVEKTFEEFDAVPADVTS